MANNAAAEVENGCETDLAAHGEFSGSRTCRPLKLISATSCVGMGLDTTSILADSAEKRDVVVLRNLQDR